MVRVNNAQKPTIVDKSGTTRLGRIGDLWNTVGNRTVDVESGRDLGQ